VLAGGELGNNRHKLKRPTSDSAGGPFLASAVGITALWRERFGLADSAMSLQHNESPQLTKSLQHIERPQRTESNRAMRSN